MPQSVIPEDVAQFIQYYVDSIAHWEGLLLMRANLDLVWNPEKIAEGLYISRDEGEALLERLTTLGLLQRDSDPPSYRYQPIDPSVETAVDRVAEYYSRYLIPMTNLIHEKRQSRVQKFADAFRIRKD